jgi:CheY-like chemotaxis protein
MQNMVFIVDDNDVNLVMAAAMLENDYRVLTMPSAEKMFAILGKKRPGLILLDVEMPEMDGFEAIAVLKENPEWRDIPVVIHSSRKDECDLKQAYELGAVDVILKPFEPKLLLECINKHIRN